MVKRDNIKMKTCDSCSGFGLDSSKLPLTSLWDMPYGSPRVTAHFYKCEKCKGTGKI